MEVERYSHVLHLVSHVEGRLRAGARRARRAARGLPGRHAVRRAEGPRDAAHRRRRGRAARAVRRRRRLPRLRRQPRHGDHDPERGPARRARPTSTRAPGSSPAACRRASSRRPSTRPPRCAGRSSWPPAPRMRPGRRTLPGPMRRETAKPQSGRGHDPRRRQLRLVHVQPRPGARRPPAPTSASSATTRSTGRASRRSPPTPARTCAGSSSRRARATRRSAGVSVDTIEVARGSRDPAARRVPRDAVDGGGVRCVDRPRADARPRRGVGGHARRRRPARGHAAVVHGRPLPLARGRRRDAARRSCASPR